MRVSFFGQYLVARGIISQAQLIEALEYQASTNRRIGELAIERGYLNSDQVDDILNEQVRRDLSFGAIALEKGLLQRSVLYDLLFAQNIRSVYVGEAIVHKGFSDMETVGRELAGFTKHFKEREKDLAFLLDGFPESILVKIILDSLGKSFLRFACCNVKVLYAGEMKHIIEEFKKHIIIEIRDENMAIVVVLAISYSNFVNAENNANTHEEINIKTNEMLFKALNIAVGYIEEALKNFGMCAVLDSKMAHGDVRKDQQIDNVIEISITSPFGDVSFSIHSHKMLAE